MKHLTSVFLLALLLCLCCLPAAQAEGTAILTLTSSADSGYGGDEITLSLALTAENLGGLQTALTWNSGYLTYVEGSAAFSDSFTQSAMTSMINDSGENRITLVYGNTGGYTAQDEVIFTARFLLNEDVSGDTTFTLSGTKASDASSSLSALSVETSTACVTTQIFDAGSVMMNVEVSESSPRLGSRITVTLNLYSYTEAVGSLQGSFRYDPNVLQYVTGSAAFSEDASSTAITKLINDSTAGKINFVYASTSGCTAYEFITMEFEVIGGVNNWYNLTVDSMKATNARTDHLALMNAGCWSASLWPQGEPDTVYLTTWLHEGGYVPCGSTVTLALRADGMTFGGLQCVVNYDPDQLSYVPGSAAYSAAFREDASITMINDATDGQLRLVYANPNGYTPDNSDILTAQFVIRETGYLNDITLTGLKATNTGADITSVPISGLNEISWYVTPGEYDMSAARWDYTEALIYDGTEKMVQLTGLPEGLTPVYSGNTATAPGSYWASVTFEYDTEHYYEPYMSDLNWIIEQPTATEISVTPSRLVLSTESPWNMAYYTYELLPAMSRDENILFSGDYSLLSSYESGYVEAHTPGTTQIILYTEDGRLSATCEVVIVESLSKATLPDGLTAIETEAFCGATSLEVVILPDAVTSIESRAFADSGLLYIQIPASVTSIAADAFDGSSLQMIYCPSGSTAAAFAAEHGIPWIEY